MDKMKFYYFDSTHWDREWYKPFQYFRGILLENTERILDTLEHQNAYQKFFFDGQTIVLEDITEIRPDLKERLSEQIRKGRLNVGPWYLMPDELLVSGESLIRNLLRGRRIAQKYGASPWPVGYVPDIFGHIAQLPQIMRGFGIGTIVAWRGFEDDLAPYARWAAPDGTTCNLIRHPQNGYGEFTAFPKETRQLFQEYLLRWMESAKEIYGDEIVLTDAFDHSDIDSKAPELLDAIRELYPDAEIRWTDFTDIDAFSKPDLPVIRGEQIHTCKGVRCRGIQIPYTLSSRIDVKSENDQLQNRLELEIEPMAVFMGKRFSPNLRGMLDLAWKKCLQNQPHDSICGCSIDAVHELMHSRSMEANQICDFFRDALIRQDRTDLTGKELGGCCEAGDGRYTLRVFNTLPWRRKEILPLTIHFIGPYPETFAESRSSEALNAFRLFDASGREIPYIITDIRRNVRTALWKQAYRTFDLYTITAEVELAPSSWSTFHLEPSRTPVRRYGTLRTAKQQAENEFLRLTVHSDGTFDVLDKRSGRTFSDLNDFVIDRETGDGWGHVKPLCNEEIIHSVSAQTAVTEDNLLRTTFEITRDYEVPEEVLFSGTVNAFYGSTTLSEHRKRLRIVTSVTLDRISSDLKLRTRIENTIRDCRLRLRIPTGIEGRCFTGQTFTMIERLPGREKGERTQDYREAETIEKNFNGIAGKRDKLGGIALLSHYGLHEISSSESGELFITLFRAFRRTVMSEGEPAGELQKTLHYEYTYRFFHTEEFPELFRELQTRKTPPVIYTLATETIRGTPEHPALELSGRLTFSALKPAENMENTAVLRLVNLSGKTEQASVRLPGRSGIRTCNLAEDPDPGSAAAKAVDEFQTELAAGKIGSYLLSRS